MRIKYLSILIFLILIPSIFASVTLRQGEVYEVSNKELIVENIASDKIKVNVDGIKNIINVGDQKIVNGVDILVQSVFYDDLPEERTVEVVMSIAYYCGDGNCDSDQDETKENCCEDCGCNPGYVCSDKVCKTETQVAREKAEEEEKTRDKCERDSDCDDNDDYTEDICLSTPGKPNKCLNMPPICTTDIECDDQNPCTVDRCVDKDCFNTKVPDYIDCLEGQEVELEEDSKEIIPEEVAEGTDSIFEEAVEEEGKGFFSRILSFFLNLF